MMQPTVYTKKLKTGNHASCDTGEILINTSNKKYSVRETIIDEDTFTVSSEEYVILDSRSLAAIKPYISYSDFGALIYMCKFIKCHYNVCMKDEVMPHSTATISEDLKITVQGARKILNKLVDKNILAYAICYPAGYKQKIYMVNPTLLRNSKTFSKCIYPLFKDLTIDKPKSK